MYSIVYKYNTLFNALAIFIINLTILAFNAINTISQPDIIIYALNTIYYLFAIIILIVYFILWTKYNKFDRNELSEQMKLAIKPT